MFGPSIFNCDVEPQLTSEDGLVSSLRFLELNVFKVHLVPRVTVHLFAYIKVVLW